MGTVTAPVKGIRLLPIVNRARSKPSLSIFFHAFSSCASLHEMRSRGFLSVFPGVRGFRSESRPQKSSSTNTALPNPE
jgi:hypothetical protein